MGTIVIEEYQDIGTPDNGDAPVYRLDKLTKRTSDASTSTTPESIELNPETALVRVYTEEIHRIGVSAAAVGNSGAYVTTKATDYIDLGVKGGTDLYYRLNA